MVITVNLSPEEVRALNERVQYLEELTHTKVTRAMAVRNALMDQSYKNKIQKGD